MILAAPEDSDEKAGHFPCRRSIVLDFDRQICRRTALCNRRRATDTKKLAVKETEKRDKKENGGHLSPYPVSRLAPSFELVDLAREIAKADDLLSMQTGGKLKLLADQIRGLQEEALAILEKTRRDQQLHRAECNFAKKPGQVYHLYAKEDQSLVFSMLSPADWRGRQPYRFEGSFRLESDMSWTEMDDEKT